MYYFGQDEGSHQYINTMEVAQVHTKKANIPISDKSFAPISDCAMLGTDRYADEMKA